jgi:hypothetical protein
MGKHGNKYQVNLHRQKIAKISLKTYMHLQGGVEGCADILTCNRTPQKITIKTIMSYTNADIFREKRAKSFSKKVWKPLNFMKKCVKKNHSRLFLLSFNSKLSHFDKNINLFSQLCNSIQQRTGNFEQIFNALYLKNKKTFTRKKIVFNFCSIREHLHILQNVAPAPMQF